MSATALIQLAQTVKPVLSATLEAAKDNKFLMGEVNQTANQLIRQLRQVSQDGDLTKELRDQADVLREGLRFIAKQSCERYEALGGFGYFPQSLAA